MSAVHYAEMPERIEALQAGVNLLHSVWPRVVVEGLVSIGPNAVPVRFTLDQHMVLRVVCRYTGTLVAQSLPGVLGVLDQAALGYAGTAEQARKDAATEIAEALWVELANGPSPGELLHFLADQLKDCLAGVSAADLAEALRSVADRS